MYCNTVTHTMLLKDSTAAHYHPYNVVFKYLCSKYRSRLSTIQCSFNTQHSCGSYIHIQLSHRILAKIWIFSYRLWHQRISLMLPHLCSDNLFMLHPTGQFLIRDHKQKKPFRNKWWNAVLLKWAHQIYRPVEVIAMIFKIHDQWYEQQQTILQLQMISVTEQ